MKQILSVLILTLITNLSFAQFDYKFIVDGKDYYMPEPKLNDCFGRAFDTIVERNVAKEHNFSLWAETFGDWKKVVNLRDMHIETIGNRISKTSYSGDVSAEYRGFNKNGKEAKGNPNDKRNLGSRMSILYTYLANEVVRELTGKIVK